jgi:predicted RNase H-like HicB family nuclease
MSAPGSCPVVIEEGETSNGASVPDLPGCVAVADTAEEVETLIRDAIEFHIEGLREDGNPVPTPHSQAVRVLVSA